MPKHRGKCESYRLSLLESLRKQEESAQYLNACRDDEDARVFPWPLETLPTPTAESGRCRVKHN